MVKTLGLRNIVTNSLRRQICQKLTQSWRWIRGIDSYDNALVYYETSVLATSSASNLHQVQVADLTVIYAEANSASYSSRELVTSSLGLPGACWLQSEVVLRLVGIMVCLHAAPRVSLYIGANNVLHNALRNH